MLVMQNFELASRSVPNKSYEARRKLRPLGQEKKILSFSGFFSQKMMRAGGFLFCWFFLGGGGAWPTLNHAHILPTSS